MAEAHKLTLEDKICSVCKVPKKLTEFPKGNKGRNKQYAYPYCKDCHNLRATTERLRRLFNITPEERDGLFASQGNVCAICKRPAGPKKFHIDHNHKTGLIRGGLCWLCNRLLGIVRDNLERLQAAADYLKRPPAVAYFGAPRYGRLGRTTSRIKTVKKLEQAREGFVAKEMAELYKYQMTKEAPAVKGGYAEAIEKRTPVSRKQTRVRQCHDVAAPDGTRKARPSRSRKPGTVRGVWSH